MCVFLYISRRNSAAAMVGGPAAQLSVLRCNDSEKTGARSAANTKGHLSTSEKLHFIGSGNFPPNWDF